MEKQIKTIDIEQGFIMLVNQNTSQQSIKVEKEIDSSYVQIHFCLHQNAKLFFNEGRYSIDVQENKSMLLYNPNQNLPMDIELANGGKMISILISIEKLHTFFTPEAGIIHFLTDENRSKKYYADKKISAGESIVLTQLMDNKVQPVMEKLYLKAKIYELLGIYFQPQDNNSNCPFLQQEENVEKIRKAKSILLERMAEPPTLQQLADEIGLPVHYLKDGFKQIYGDTVFNFLWEYKMEYARRKLDTKKYNVSEVAYDVGYSTPSHFIAAFKKKYGITPKKYIGNNF